MFKLVCAENFMLFGPSGSELPHFQNLAFPLHLNGIRCCSEFFLLQRQIPIKSKESRKYLNIQNKVTRDRTVQTT